MLKTLTLGQKMIKKAALQLSYGLLAFLLPNQMLLGHTLNDLLTNGHFEGKHVVYYKVAAEDILQMHAANASIAKEFADFAVKENHLVKKAGGHISKQTSDLLYEKLYLVSKIHDAAIADTKTLHALDRPLADNDELNEQGQFGPEWDHDSLMKVRFGEGELYRYLANFSIAIQLAPEGVPPLPALNDILNQVEEEVKKEGFRFFPGMRLAKLKKRYTKFYEYAKVLMEGYDASYNVLETFVADNYDKLAAMKKDSPIFNKIDWELVEHSRAALREYFENLKQANYAFAELSEKEQEQYKKFDERYLNSNTQSLKMRFQVTFEGKTKSIK